MLTLEPFNPQKIREMTKRKEAVLYLLQHRPFLRGNDNLLVVYFMHYFHGVPWEPIKYETGGVHDIILHVHAFGDGKVAGIKALTSTETITRIRRKLQEEYRAKGDNSLEPTPERRLVRDVREMDVRGQMVSEDWQL